MREKGEKLIVIRARFPLDISESAIDEIITYQGNVSEGKRRIEIYRRIDLPRDIQWLIYPGEEPAADRDLYCNRLTASLSEYSSVDITIWKTI